MHTICTHANNNIAIYVQANQDLDIHIHKRTAFTHRHQTLNIIRRFSHMIMNMRSELKLRIDRAYGAQRVEHFKLP
jgi:hypothetical protein